MLAVLLSLLGLIGLSSRSSNAAVSESANEAAPASNNSDDSSDDSSDNGNDSSLFTPHGGSTPDSGSGSSSSGSSPDITLPSAPTGNETDNDNDSGTTTTLGPDASGSAISGRVQTFDFEDDSIAAIKVIAQPDYGNVTVNPDNTLAVVLTGSSQSDDLNFSVEVSYDDGTVEVRNVALDVSKGPQDGGWGLGNHYMLEVDENDNIIVEHGENHQKVYVSGDADALSLADIAALEGISVNSVTQGFLLSHAEYGRSESMALAEDAGARLWKGLTGEGKEPGSHWLLLDRGFEYDTIHDAFENGTEGESELHPIYIGAYGDGDHPVVTGDPRFTGLGSKNLVIQGLEFTNGFTSLASENLLLDQVNVSGAATNIQSATGVTVRNSNIVDAVDSGAKDGITWSPHGDRESGIYVSKVDGLLIENTFFDHNGWAEGYDFDGDASMPQPPSIYSHNVYLQKNNLDVTFRDNISMRGASFGAQVRSGGLIEDNVFIDNNAGVNFLKGNDTDGKDLTGNYTLFTDNLVTSGGHRAAAEGQGALTFGITAATEMSALVDNIVTHLANPNDPQELANKPVTHTSVKYGENTQEILYDDTIVYNWAGANAYANDNVKNKNIDGLDTDILDQTTIQLFTAQLLGKPDATIEDLANYLRLQASGGLDNVVDADLILDFFQTGFGLRADIRTDAETLRFVPNDLGEGVRWDNRLNWDTEDLPGAVDGDSVDLAGNWVVYGGTTTLEDLDFGNSGRLGVTNGYLEIEDHIAVGDNGARLEIDKSGQFWTDGYTDKDTLTISAGGGRFANTNLFTGTTHMELFDNAQAILATDGADFALNANSELDIKGSDVKVGFDGENGETAVLLLAEGSELSFSALDSSGLSTIEEFYSGHYDETDVQSGVNLGKANLTLDITEMSGGAAMQQTLIAADEIIGDFGNVDIVGLASNQNATLTIDYDTDEVFLSLSEAGSGQGKVTVDTIGSANNAQSATDLWEALTNGHGIYPDDPVADIPSEEDIDEAA